MLIFKFLTIYPMDIIHIDPHMYVPIVTTLTAKIIHIAHNIIRTDLTMCPIFSLCDEILTQESGFIVCAECRPGSRLNVVSM